MIITFIHHHFVTFIALFKKYKESISGNTGAPDVKFQGHSFPFQLCGFCLSAHFIQSNYGWIQPRDQRPEAVQRKSVRLCRR